MTKKLSLLSCQTIVNDLLSSLRFRIGSNETDINKACVERNGLTAEHATYLGEDLQLAYDAVLVVSTQMTQMKNGKDAQVLLDSLQSQWSENYTAMEKTYTDSLDARQTKGLTQLNAKLTAMALCISMLRTEYRMHTPMSPPIICDGPSA